MAKPKVIIFSGYGLNSEEETKFAFELVGAKADIVHINDLISGEYNLKNYQIMVFPGGFSYGDDTGGGNAYANKLKNNLWEDILKFVNSDKLTVGICNGCQIMSNLGLVPAFDKNYGKREVVFNYNKTARLQCRWVHIKNVAPKSIFTKGIDIFKAPVAHGEGNFYAEPKVLERLKKQNQIIFKYVKENGAPAKGEFPFNPNGAIEDIAAISDETGKVLAIMPHPERNLFFTNSDDWTLEKEILRRKGKKLPKEGEGVEIFKNMVKWFR